MATSVVIRSLRQEPPFLVIDVGMYDMLAHYVDMSSGISTSSCAFPNTSCPNILTTYPCCLAAYSTARSCAVPTNTASCEGVTTNHALRIIHMELKGMAGAYPGCEACRNGFQFQVVCSSRKQSISLSFLL